jgi:hypothetical protein
VRPGFNAFQKGLVVTAAIATVGLGLAAPASAATKIVTPNAATPKVVPGSSCSSWVSGQWGHAKCTNNTGRVIAMDLHVECNAFWDANIDKSAQFQSGTTIEMQGECYSSVDWVTGNTR